MGQEYSDEESEEIEKARILAEQFDGLRSNLKIKIISSEAHTNSIVKSFKDIKTIIYKSFQNENLVIINSDNNDHDKF